MVAKGEVGGLFIGRNWGSKQLIIGKGSLV